MLALLQKQGWVRGLVLFLALLLNPGQSQGDQGNTSEYLAWKKPRFCDFYPGPIMSTLFFLPIDQEIAFI